MSDLIDRQAAINEIKEPMMLEYVWSYSCKEEEKAISVLVENICQQTKSIIANRLERLQSADVVEVVRCKDCKHLFEDNGCPLRTWWTHLENDFCSYGERREDE